jgi:peptide deformylase
MELVYFPHPALMTPTKKILPQEYDDLEDRIREMFDIMYRNRGVGLAGPQVAWNASICTINPTLEPMDELVLINPKIISRTGGVEGEEGCLSFPGIYAKVNRAQTVVVRYDNVAFERVELECSDLLARIVQHELDHLDNILLIHRMSQTDKFKNRKRLDELRSATPP